jgi:two-component system, OmpR family, sensor histidine kinase KdpD
MATSIRKATAPAEVIVTHAIGPIHVLVCISGARDDLRLIRHGALLAERLHGRLTVLFVFSPAGRQRPGEALQGARLFARSVGAPLVELPAASLVDGIAGYTADRRASHIVLSEEQRTPWYAVWHGSLVEHLAERLTNVEIYVLGEASLAARD